jgi:hypothetical protein
VRGGSQFFPSHELPCSGSKGSSQILAVMLSLSKQQQETPPESSKRM